MDEVGLAHGPGGVAVTVDGQVLHTAGSEQEARALGQWVRYQLAEGHSLDDVGRMLRGEPLPGDAPDLSVLDGTIGDLKRALDSGAHDIHLRALLDAERDAKDRRGAVTAIEKRLADRD